MTKNGVNYFDIIKISQNNHRRLRRIIDSMKNYFQRAFVELWLLIALWGFGASSISTQQPLETAAAKYIKTGFRYMAAADHLPADDQQPSSTYLQFQVFNEAGDFSQSSLHLGITSLSYASIPTGNLFYVALTVNQFNQSSLIVGVSARQPQFRFFSVAYLIIASQFRTYVDYHLDALSFTPGLITSLQSFSFTYTRALAEDPSNYRNLLFFSRIGILNTQNVIDLESNFQSINQTHFEIVFAPTNEQYGVIKFKCLMFKTSQMIPNGLIYLQYDYGTLSATIVDSTSTKYDAFTATNTFIGLQRVGVNTTEMAFSSNFAENTYNQLRIRLSANVRQYLLHCLLIDQTQCQEGFFELGDFKTCQKCMENCLSCSEQNVCLMCQHTFAITHHAVDNVTCECTETVLTGVCSDFSSADPKYGCTYAYVDPSDNTTVKCKQCSSELHLQVNADGHCQCQTGYQESTFGVCQEYCGDGVVYEAECDDGNTNDGDGCSSMCQLEAGFSCSVDSNGSTLCKGNQVLALEVISVIKNRNNSALFTYETTDKTLPFDLEYSQFTSLTSTKMFNFSITVGSEVIPLIDVHMTTVQGLRITFLINYDFTMESFDLSLNLNTSQTRYNTESLSLTETVRGSEDPVIYSDYWDSYESISTGMLVLNCLVVTVLFVGVFAPKFIGLETVLVLQVIYFSQIMVLDTEDWPAGFMYLENLKYSKGFNSLFDFTSYSPIDSRSRKLNKIAMEKAILQNLSVSGAILILSFIAFMITQIVRSNSFENLVQFVAKKNKQKSPDVKKQQSRERALLIKKYTDYCEVNLKAFNALTQISLWVLLQILAAFSANSDIANSIVVILQSSSVNLFLKIGSLLLMVSLTLCLVVFFNFIKNILLSPQTIGKLSERPFQHNYKLVTFLYICVMGFLIFFLREFQINTGSVTISSSMLALVTHCMYFGYILKINPYQVSLNIHKMGLIINQIVLLVFLVYLNMINLVDSFPEIIDLAMGFFLALCCAGMIVLSVVRLYYEYRYGEALEKEVQEQREKEKRQADAKAKVEFQMAVQYFEQQAKAKLTKDQKIRSENPFLIENQLKEDLMSDLLDWLQTRSIWTKEMKEKYYFARFERKPLKWLKINDPPKYAQHMAQVQKKRQEYLIKRQKKLEDPEYIQLKNRLKGELKQLKKNAQN